MVIKYHSMLHETSASNDCRFFVFFSFSYVRHNFSNFSSYLFIYWYGYKINHKLTYLPSLRLKRLLCKRKCTITGTFIVRIGSFIKIYNINKMLISRCDKIRHVHSQAVTLLIRLLTLGSV